jgi:hypothetical protein
MLFDVGVDLDVGVAVGVEVEVAVEVEVRILQHGRVRAALEPSHVAQRVRLN